MPKKIVLFHLKRSIFVLFFIAILTTCKDSKGNEIVKIETKYEIKNSQKDTIIYEQTIYYANGDYLHTVYYFEGNENAKTMDLYNSKKKLLSEMEILPERSDTSFVFYEYDKLDNLDKIKRSLQGYVSDRKVYVNYYHFGKLIEQKELDYNGEMLSLSAFAYDTLGYSKIESKYKKYNIKDTAIYAQTFYYKNDTLLRMEEIHADTTIYFFEYIYDNSGRLISEDLPSRRINMRHFYTYENNYVSKISQQGRFCKDGTSLGNEEVIKTFNYEFDKKNRPIKTIETRYREEKPVKYFITITEYFD